MATKRRPARRKRVSRAKVSASAQRKFKKNHAWGVLGLLFALISLGLLYFRAVQSGVVLALLAVVFCENQKNIWHSKINVWGTILGILAFVLHLVIIGL